MKRWLSIIVLCSAMAHAQGVPVNGEALKSSSGQSSAPVRVCVKESAGTPCFPLADIYNDESLTSPKSNPFLADSHGNYSYYVLSGTYKEQVGSGSSAVNRMIAVGSSGPGGSVDGVDIAPKSVKVGGTLVDGSGPISVKAYGAKGDGATDDKAAIQAAIDAALARNNGGEVVLPSGLYRVTGTTNVGLPIFGSYSWLTDRVGPMDDPTYNANTISANKTANESKPPVTIRFEQGAAILADFAPSVPTPVIAYNLRNGRGRILNARILGTTAVSGGKEVDPGAKAANKLIGIVGVLGLKTIENLYTSGIEHGFVSAGGYWTLITNSHCNYGAGTCLNLAGANAIQVVNTLATYMGAGTVYDGAGSTIVGMHTQQAAKDLVVFQADSTTFDGAYFEDVDSSDGTGTYAVTLGTSEGASQLTSTVFQNIRVGHTRTGKKAFRVWSSKNTQFTASRSFGRGVDVDSISYGVIQACDGGDFDNTTTFDPTRWIRPANAGSGDVTVDNLKANASVQSAGVIQSKLSSQSIGYAAVQPGTASTAGRFEVYNTSGTRTGYIGDSNTDFKFVVNVGMMKFSGGSGSQFDNQLIAAGKFAIGTVASYTCNSAARGHINYIAGAAGVKDIFQVCAKDASNNYAWRMVDAATASDVGAVPTTTTVAGKALSGNITIACADLSDDGDACSKSVGTGATNVAAGDHTHAELGSVYKKRPCEITITGSGTSGVLQDTDDELGKCKNMYGATLTVESVSCWADTGSPTIMVSAAGGADILTGNVTAGTFASPGTGTLSGSPTVAANGALDFKVVSAGGTAHEITCAVGRTL